MDNADKELERGASSLVIYGDRVLLLYSAFTQKCYTLSPSRPAALAVFDAVLDLRELKIAGSCYSFIQDKFLVLKKAKL